MTIANVRLAMLLLALLPIWSGASRAQAAPPAELRSGSLLLAVQQGYVEATLLNTNVDMDVSGLVARVSVRQEFHNQSQDWVEATYVFPLPETAGVDRLRVYVGERFIEGEIHERSEARKAYEQARAEGRKTSLVEQQRANLFTTAVANVAPGEHVTVEIEYLEHLRFEDGIFSIRFPMTLTPRYVPGEPSSERQGSGWSSDTDRVADASRITPPMATASDGHRITLSARIDSGLPLEVIASRYHPVDVAEDAGLYTIMLSGGSALMNHDFELLWRPVRSSAPRAMAFSELVDGEAYYLLMVMPPDSAASAVPAMPREMIFVIDSSGSMHGVSLQQAKAATRRALQGLGPGDRFNIIEFNSYARSLFPRSVAADPANVGRAADFVAGLQANGGTNMRTALEVALMTPATSSHLRQIVFITDGSVGNEHELYSLIDRRLGSSRLFTVGIGAAPNSWFMRKSAELGRGTFTIISSLQEVAEKMDRLFRKLESPQVTGIDIHWPAGVIVEAYPEVVPDLYLGDPVAVRARIEGPLAPGATMTVTGSSTAGAWSRELPLAVQGDDPGVAALWARARIADLHDQGRRGTDTEFVRRSIIETALEHHLVSRYTSLVAVDKTPAAGGPLEYRQVANLMPRGQGGNVVAGFPGTATPAAAWMLQGILLIGLAVALAAARGRKHARPA